MKMKLIRFSVYPETISETLFKNVTNCKLPCSKPASGGLWASPYISTDEVNPYYPYLSDWERFCATECKDYPEYRNYYSIFEINSDNIALIDSFDDYLKLINECPHIFYDYIGLNFEKISQKYDAIYLTKKGQLECNKLDPTIVHYNGKKYEDQCALHSWDCESLLIFNLTNITVSSYGIFRNSQEYICCSV